MERLSRCTCSASPAFTCHVLAVWIVSTCLSSCCPAISRRSLADFRSVPHVTNAIKDWIKRVAKVPVDGSSEEPDVCIIELGGTVGDIESMPFVEALTQLRHEAGPRNFMNIHVSYVPTIHGEQKTKPTQHAVKSVRSYGLIPDLVCKNGSCCPDVANKGQGRMSV